MNIFFAFSYSSIYFLYKLFILSCYAVVNLRFVFANRQIWAPFRVGGLNEDIDHLVASQPSVPLHLCPRLCRRWWAQMDSDHRPHAYQACALTSWAMSPYVVEVIGFEPMTPCLQGRCSTSWAIPPFPKITLPFFSGSLLFIKNE